MPLSVPPLKFRCGYSLSHIYKDTVPFYIRSNILPERYPNIPRRTYFVVYAYSPYVVIEGSFNVHFGSETCSFPQFFPCIKIQDQILGKVTSTLDRNTNRYNTVSGVVPEVQPARKNCFVQPIHPVRLQQCSLSFRGPRYIYIYQIHYYASTDQANCPA